MDPKEIVVTWYVALCGAAHAYWFEFENKLKNSIEDGMLPGLLKVYSDFRIGGRWSLTRRGSII